MGGSIFNFATATKAADITGRIAAPAPGPAQRIATREPIVPFSYSGQRHHAEERHHRRVVSV
ncbi:hypothetical protein [Arthrobacter sp. OAP107]|uniref:hypothetical protein n=1 Tax=Arthrobacter sp. OAP107 TaxID=3156445 RepID=UPI003390D12D